MALVTLFIVVTLGFIGGFAWYRYRESKHLKKSAKETMGRGLRLEIEKESQDALRRKTKFEEKLKKFDI